MEVFTLYVRAVAIRNETSEVIERSLIDYWISVFGAMEFLQSHVGAHFVGDTVRNLSMDLGIDIVKTFPLHHQGNGIVEKWNKTLQKYLA